MFKVGDRVMITLNTPNIVGKFGTIKWIDGGCYAVEFDENIDGHSCNGMAALNRGYYLLVDQIELLFEDEISKAAMAYTRKELSC